IVDKPEMYDPATGTFSPTADYADRTGDPYFRTQGLTQAPATLLPDGTVLIASEPSAELFDPASGTFRIAGKMTRGAFQGRTPGWQIGGTSTLLANGNVLLAGGEEFETDYYSDAELYDPLAGQFSAVSKMNLKRTEHSATLLRDGTVLIAGGQTFGNIAS